MFKMTFKVFGTLAIAIILFFIGLIAYIYFSDSFAEKKSRQFCDSVPLGSNTDDILAKISSMENKIDNKTVINEMISVTWKGSFLNRWTCILSIEKNTVIDKELRLLD